LATARRLYPSASEKSFFARGAGGNLTWIDPKTTSSRWCAGPTLGLWTASSLS
jgi:hypothetical protein